MVLRSALRSRLRSLLPLDERTVERGNPQQTSQIDSWQATPTIEEVVRK
jgi:hypothetical protein